MKLKTIFFSIFSLSMEKAELQKARKKRTAKAQQPPIRSR